MSISNEALDGLKTISKQHGLSDARNSNVSRLVELIGLFIFSVTDHSEDSIGYVDEFGLSEVDAFKIGFSDAEQQKTPQFLERFGKRHKLLVKSYMRGYSSFYVDTTSLQTGL